MSRIQVNYQPPTPITTSSTQDNKKKNVHAKTGRVNYTALEDVTKGTQVMTGMFSVNQRPVVVLFDSGASHTFISEACVARLNLQVTHMKRPYIIHAPGAQLNVSQCVSGVSLDLDGKKFEPLPLFFQTEE
jgi:predicted aspartyl protease